MHHRSGPGEHLRGVFARRTLTAVLFLALTVGAKAQTADAKAQAQTHAVVTAATAFLGMLRANQRAKAQYAFTPLKAASRAVFTRKPGTGIGLPPPPEGGWIGERYGEAVWSNYPVNDVPRPGLKLGEMSPSQRAAAMRLLHVLLSAKGYDKIRAIMAADQALHDEGQPFPSGEDVYSLAIFGKPSAETPWMLEDNGHHLGLNVVIAGPHGVMTPTLTGAQPAVFKTAEGKTVRVLAAENDKGFALLNALSDAQRKQAILNYHVGDLVQGPGHDGETILPEGLKASAMDARQKAMLLDVIGEWAGIVNDAYANPRMAEIKAGLDDTYFAWSGPTTHKPGQNGSSYYRIQGPKLLIEFSPQATNGDPIQHVHTIYRDPSNAYGHLYTIK